MWGKFANSMNNDKLIEAYEAISNPEASILRKAEGYDLLLRKLFNIQVDEHKEVCSPIHSKADDQKFMQSLCTRLSKLMTTEAEAEAEAEGDGEGDGESDENTDTGKETNEMSERFKESGKSVEDFIEELRKEGLNSEGSSNSPEEFNPEPSKPGVGSTPLDRPAGKRSPIMEALISKQWCISTEDKRNYKKFLPQVWINPTQPWKIKQNETIEKPLVMFCGDSGGYSHQKMIAALLALPESIAKTFDAENTCLSGYGKYEGKRVHFDKLPKYKSILVFTNGCNTDHQLAKTIANLINSKIDVKVYTMFNEGCNCGCPTFNYLRASNIHINYSLEL